MVGSRDAKITDWFNEASVSDLGAVGRGFGSGTKSRTISKISTEFEIISRSLQGVVAFRIYLHPRGNRATVSSQLELGSHEASPRYLPRLCQGLSD